jgi:hypothetical protein
LFSDALTYRFRLRPLTARATEGVPAFGPGPDEYRFDLTFDAPAGRDGGRPATVRTSKTTYDAVGGFAGWPRRWCSAAKSQLPSR